MTSADCWNDCLHCLAVRYQVDASSSATYTYIITPSECLSSGEMHVPIYDLTFCSNALCFLRNCSGHIYCTDVFFSFGHAFDLPPTSTAGRDSNSKKKKKKKWARCMHFAFALCTGCKNYTYYAHTLIFVRISDVIFVMTCDMAGSLLW